MSTGSSASTPIEVDVGGTIFKTRRSTLEKSDMLKMVLSHHTSEKSQLFIDEDPKLFTVLLSILRNPSSVSQHPPHITSMLFVPHNTSAKRRF